MLRDARELNALVAPIAPGDVVQLNGRKYLCETDMSAQWRIYIQPEDLSQTTITWNLVAGGITSQTSLIAWFESRQGSHSSLAS